MASAKNIDEIQQPATPTTGRPPTILRVNYSARKYEISADDITEEKFTLLMNRRKINKAAVNSIYEALKSRIHFEQALVVNKRNGKYRLIDGNHRYEAVRRFLSEFPNQRIEVVLHEYTDLTEPEEKRLYTRHNIGRKQSTNDFVMQYKGEIAIFPAITDPTRFPVPVTVYPSSTSTTFYKVVGAYLAAREKRYQGGYINKPLDFIDEAKRLGVHDVAAMRRYVAMLVKLSGPVRGNVWFKTTPMNALMRIWLANRDREDLPAETMERLFQERLIKNPDAIDWASTPGLSAGKRARDEYLIMLNEGRDAGLFLSGDIEPEEGDGDSLDEFDIVDDE